MRAFKADITHLGEAFLLTTQYSLCQPCPWHQQPSITEALLGCCPAAVGKTGVFKNLPPSPTPTRAGCLGVNWVFGS